MRAKRPRLSEFQGNFPARYVTPSTTVLSKYAYTFDDSNHRDVRTSLGRQSRDTSNTLSAYQTVNYSYDTVAGSSPSYISSTDQLVGETSTEATPQVKMSYAYDLMGNRTGTTDQGAGIGGTVAQNNATTQTNNRLNQVTSVALS